MLGLLKKVKGSVFEGPPPGLYGGAVEGENKGSLSAAGYPCPLRSRFPDTWASECRSGRTRPPETAPAFSNPNRVSPLFVLPELLPQPRLGLGSRLPRKIEAPAS